MVEFENKGCLLKWREADIAAYHSAGGEQRGSSGFKRRLQLGQLGWKLS